MEIQYENDEVRKLVTPKFIEEVICIFANEFGEESVEKIKEIFISDSENKVRYFFYNEQNDLIFKESDEKSDLT